MSSSTAALSGSYDVLLVSLSVVIAILAAYAALDFTVRINAARGSLRLVRLVGGAICMGVGIWSMHYVGMLAFRLPIPVRYDWPTVVLSLLAAVFASAVALFVVSRKQMGLVRATLASIVMGGGIATMHYVGMEAMRLAAIHTYSPSLVALSVVLAIVISFVALWLTFHLRADPKAWSRKKLLSALVMGAAIPVMHYTGMAAVTFIPSTTHLHDVSRAVGVSALGTVAIIVITLLLLGLAPMANLKIDSLSHTRQLTVRHFLFLAVLGLVSILGIVLIEQEGRQLAQDSRLINEASRQIMLSRELSRDLLLAARPLENTEAEELARRARETWVLWRRSHESLKQNHPDGAAAMLIGGVKKRVGGAAVHANVEPENTGTFATIDAAYVAMSRSVQRLLGQLSSAEIGSLLNELLGHEQSYLQRLSELVSHYEQNSETRQARRDRLYVFMLMSLLGVLLLQGLVVLRPALSRIQHGIGELERTTQALHRQVSFVELLQSVAVAANEATSTDTVLQFALDRICAHTGWPVGHVYLCAPDSADLISSSLWHVDDPERFASLCNATQRTRLHAGMGLPGRVVKTGKPAWIRDVRDESSFAADVEVAALDVRGAFGFPVLVQGKVVAVLEFFSHRVEEPDDELLNVMANVGTQLGQVVERARAQEEIARNAEDLARSNAELEQFAYVASHDLQEPLRMVASFTQLLARRYRGQLDSEADEYIGYAVDGAQRMQTLILDLLSYARLSTKGQSPQPINTATVCEAALAQLKQSIKERNAVITVEQLPTVVGYATQLTQLFQNLIGNALKYCNRQQPEVHVSAQATPDHWIFSVRDNGIGIEPQYFERIFQMFKRLHTREQYSGTGIGLALCKKIVARHRGQIWVESQPGKGSNFLFTIPRTEGLTS
ncbi:GAF domain-containing protein [Steroidobacter sp. S1-65]|uniref:histidine kinase n=1 Tax=Steroidobacter gossypii TaxID=2805490 RepID=A0ABS1WUM8_9GAMM|nr:MHYT domain-containing protein [Steroidobacter gossypii]MBM0104680.1 GAF domain-containing protein [Steroidobacter gossypii]